MRTIIMLFFFYCGMSYTHASVDPIRVADSSDILTVIQAADSATLMEELAHEKELRKAKTTLLIFILGSLALGFILVASFVKRRLRK